MPLPLKLLDLGLVITLRLVRFATTRLLRWGGTLLPFDTTVTDLLKLILSKEDDVMGNRISIQMIGVVVAFSGIATPFTSTADDRDDRLVCYLWDIFPDERYKLNVKLHSALSERKEEKKFGHASQTAYSVHGKEVGGCGGDTMFTTTGTVVTAKPSKHSDSGKPTPVGAHMGLEVHISRGDGYLFGKDFCRSIEVDCTSDEISATPKKWTCESRNEFDVYHGISTLVKVDEKKDPRCSIFEEGVVHHKPTTPTDGPASGYAK